MKNKNKKAIKEEIVITTANDEFKKLTKVLVSVVVIFTLFFVITYFVTKEDKEPIVDPIVKTEIQYDEILIGELLNQNNSEYYVLVTKESDKYVGLYNAYLTIYNKKENASRVYTANLNNVFNKTYMSTESQFSFAYIKDIRFKQTTMLKIQNKQIISHYEAKEEIVNLLKDLIK